MDYKLNLYKGTVTAGGTDGELVSRGSDYSNPVHFALDAGDFDEQIIPLALRTDTGYIATDVTISDTGDTKDRYQLSTDGVAFADSITLGSVSSVNTIIFAKARTTGNEFSRTDRSAKFVADYFLEWA